MIIEAPRRSFSRFLRLSLAAAAVAVAGIGGTAATSTSADAGRVYVSFYGPAYYRPVYRPLYRPDLLVAPRWVPCPFNPYRLCRI